MPLFCSLTISHAGSFLSKIVHPYLSMSVQKNPNPLGNYQHQPTLCYVQRHQTHWYVLPKEFKSILQHVPGHVALKQPTIATTTALMHMCFAAGCRLKSKKTLQSMTDFLGNNSANSLCTWFNTGIHRYAIVEIPWWRRSSAGWVGTLNAFGNTKKAKRITSLCTLSSFCFWSFHLFND